MPSSGFWAGAVPPWAYVIWVGSCALFLIMGVWVGLGRRQAEAAEEERWAREQAKARRTRPVYRQPDLTRELRGEIAKWDAHFAHEARLAHEDQALTIANGRAVTTGEIQAITDEMDTWLADHVYSAPADYGQWLEQREAGHGVRDS